MRSRKAAIDGFCVDCIVDPQPGNGTALHQTTQCTSYRCKLFPFRPKQPSWIDTPRSFNLAQPDSDKRTPADQSEVIASSQEVA